MKLKKLILFIICLVFTCGCVKSTSELSIKNDRSVTLSFNVLLYDKLVGEIDKTGTSFNERFKKMVKSGIFIKDISDGSYIGKNIVVEYNDIDDISSESETDVVINKFYDDKFDSSKIFKVEKGFFMNTYYANFKYDTSRTSLTNEIYLSYLGNRVITDEEKELAKNVESKFVVNLPTSALSNNAAAVSNEAKKLIWDFAADPNKNIEFSFRLFNKTGIFAIIGSLILALILIIVLIIKIKKNANNRKSKLIHRDYDPSIEDDITNELDNIPVKEDSNLEIVTDEETIKSSETVIQNKFISNDGNGIEYVDLDK